MMIKAPDYDAGWTTEWDDMKRYGPFARHVRRLIMSLMRTVEFESVSGR